MATEELREIPLDRILCRQQVRERFDDESLAGLTQSLREVGLQQPIRVPASGEQQWTPVDGERRVRAARKAGWVTILAIIEDRDLTDREVVQRQLIANCQRSDLTAIEKARAIDRLMKDAKWTAAQVAVRLGLSSATVCRHLALLVLPEDVQQRIHAGELAPSTGYELAKTENADARAALIADSKRGRLTRDEAAQRSQAARRERKPRRAKQPRSSKLKRLIVDLGSGRNVTFSGPDLTPQVLSAWVEELLVRVRALSAKAMTLNGAKKELSAETEGSA